tara:strand:- start:5529 stop:6209 length:681 start_codon:yes stop_codon:yes gene_type:complete
MAYREPTFNANILTDLLSTYLDQKSKEREKYYKAAEKASTPKYQTVGGNIVQINRDGSTKTIFQGERKEPRFEDFPLMDKDGLPTGITAKAKFVGGNYKEAGLPVGYKKVGAKTQRAPDDKIGDLIKETRSFSRDRIKSLKRLKEGRLSPTDAIYIKQGLLPAKWSEELEGELDYYNKVVGNTRKYLPEDSAGIPTYELFLEKSKNISKEKNNTFEEVGSFWKKDK